MTGTINDLEYAHRQLDRYSLLEQTIRNGAVEIGKRTNILSANSLNPLYYALDIPEGRRVVIHVRDLLLTEGKYNIDLVKVDGWTGGTKAFKKPLWQGGSDTVQSDVYVGVTPVGTPQVIMELPLVDTGTASGNRTAAGAAALDTVLKSFTSGDVLIRVQRVGDPTDFTSSLLMVMWEKED